MHRRYKRKHQLDMQERLCEKYVQNQNDFWKDIGKAGVANDRRQNIPWEVYINGEISADKQDVLFQWEKDFSGLFQNDSHSFDESYYM